MKNTKTFNPQEGVEHVPYPASLVEAIDALILMKRQLGVGDVVESESGWKVVEKVFEVWKTVYPEHYEQFFKSQKEYWSSMKNVHGSDRGEHGAEIRKHAEIPQKLFQMMKIMFPNQEWDKKFVSGLATRLPLLRGYEKK